MPEKFFKDDIALIEATAYDEDGVTPLYASKVNWEVKLPDATSVTLVDAPITSNISVADGGAGTLTGTYDYVASQKFSNGESSTLVPASITVAGKQVNVTYPAVSGGATNIYIYRRKSPSTTYRRIATVGAGGGVYVDNVASDDTNAASPEHLYGSGSVTHTFNSTSQAGSYTAIAKFIRVRDGGQKSVVTTFEVIDALSTSTVEIDKTVDMAWTMLNDCFDSDLGGPWLRDASLQNFDKGRLKEFADVSLFRINNAQPPQSYTTTDFPFTSARPLLAKALLLESIKHLMRSYVEQPLVTGAGQISYFDRRDYLQRWQILYTVESEEFKVWLALFKRQQYQFGRSKVLVDTKTGRRMYFPALRTRFPRIGYF